MIRWPLSVYQGSGSSTQLGGALSGTGVGVDGSVVQGTSLGSNTSISSLACELNRNFSAAFHFRIIDAVHGSLDGDFIVYFEFHDRRFKQINFCVISNLDGTYTLRIAGATVADFELGALPDGNYHFGMVIRLGLLFGYLNGVVLDSAVPFRAVAGSSGITLVQSFNPGYQAAQLVIANFALWSEEMAYLANVSGGFAAGHDFGDWAITPFAANDRAMETSTTTGTSAFTLAGAVTSYVPFSVLGSLCVVPYVIVAVDEFGVPTGEWESGRGVYDEGSTALQRREVQHSSAGNSLVTFSAGTKRVFCGVLAEGAYGGLVTATQYGGDAMTMPLTEEDRNPYWSFAAVGGLDVEIPSGYGPPGGGFEFRCGRGGTCFDGEDDNGHGGDGGSFVIYLSEGGSGSAEGGLVGEFAVLNQNGDKILQLTDGGASFGRSVEAPQFSAVNSTTGASWNGVPGGSAATAVATSSTQELLYEQITGTYSSATAAGFGLQRTLKLKMGSSVGEPAMEELITVTNTTNKSVRYNMYLGYGGSLVGPFFQAETSSTGTTVGLNIAPTTSFETTLTLGSPNQATVPLYLNKALSTSTSTVTQYERTDFANNSATSVGFGAQRLVQLKNSSTLLAAFSETVEVLSTTGSAQRFLVKLNVYGATTVCPVIQFASLAANTGFGIVGINQAPASTFSATWTVKPAATTYMGIVSQQITSQTAEMIANVLDGGTTAVSGFDAKAGLFLNTLVSSTSTVTHAAQYQIVHCSGTGANTQAVDLKTATMRSGKFPLIIKDTGGNAATNNITITTEGSETIDGAASWVIAENYGYVILDSDGTNWFVVGGSKFFKGLTIAQGGTVVQEYFDIGNSGTSKTIDWKANGNKQTLTLNGNCTLTFTAPQASASLHLLIDVTGSNTITWPASVKWRGGSAPTITVTSGRTDIVTLLYRSSTGTYLADVAQTFVT